MTAADSPGSVGLRARAARPISTASWPTSAKCGRSRRRRTISRSAWSATGAPPAWSRRRTAWRGPRRRSRRVSTIPKAEIVYDILAQRGGTQLHSNLDFLYISAIWGEGAPTQGVREVAAELEALSSRSSRAAGGVEERGAGRARAAGAGAQSAARAARRSRSNPKSSTSFWRTPRPPQLTCEGDESSSSSLAAISAFLPRAGGGSAVVSGVSTALATLSTAGAAAGAAAGLPSASAVASCAEFEGLLAGAVQELDRGEAIGVRSGRLREPMEDRLPALRRLGQTDVDRDLAVEHFVAAASRAAAVAWARADLVRLSTMVSSTPRNPLRPAVAAGEPVRRLRATAGCRRKRGSAATAGTMKRSLAISAPGREC